MAVQLKEYITYSFTDNKLNVYDHGKHIVYQPFNSDTGHGFVDLEEAMSWLLRYFPDLFTPA